MSNSALAMGDCKPEDTNYLSHILQEEHGNFGPEEIVSRIGDKVISADGLTLAEVFQVLVQMLNGDLDLIKRVLALANIMAKHGMKVAEESRLTKAAVQRTLQGKESIANKQDFVKSSPTTPAIESTKKRDV
ncbi:MAG: hypothetical protein PV340_02390 [Wolbachia sp.]|nr:hypothetical protein [Wolbachia sp.]MDD9336279.1 hypothetical protein [Wolbachia sp.]